MVFKIQFLLRYNSHPTQLTHLKYTSQCMVFSTFTNTCDHPSQSQNISITTKRSPIPCGHHPLVPSLHSYATTNSLSVSVDVPVLDMLYERTSTIILLQSFVSKFLCEHIFSFLLIKYLGVELPGPWHLHIADTL